MDKVKQYLEIARKHHFWILCAVSAFAGVLAWYLASGKLKAQFDQDSQAINGVFSSLRGVDSQGPHDDWPDGIKKETAAVAADVRDAWAALYKEQKEKIFVWPKDVLSADFLDAAARLDDPQAELPRNLREYYQRRVKQLVEQLPAIVDAEPAGQAGNGGGFAGVLGIFGPGAGAPGGGGPDHKVDWSTASQQEIGQSFEWTERPSTLLVKYAQEELWVYRALCNVIKSVNEGTNGRQDAHITEINALDIAYNAVEDSPGGAGQNRVESLGTSAPTAGPAPTSPGAPGDSSNIRLDPKSRGKRELSSRGFGGASAEINPDDLLKSRRYVKADGTPLTKEEVDADTGEYRLMPFRLLLKMDSRSIDRLLVAFRNSVLPMEVQQVRINPEHVNGGGGGGFAHSGPAILGPGRGSDHAAAAASTTQQDRFVTVEIRGVVYLIRPVDPQKLPVAAASGDATAAGAPIPTAPTPGAPAETAPAATGPTTTSTPESPASPAPTTTAPGPTTTPAPATPPAGTEPAAPPATGAAPPNP
ncbi:MAG TPA: hypothetical protein VFE46_20080 [Pirellulales bacterium]|jgi:hypothetical protein|nr:hypothetical protein [Pirellulales bacterium]